MKTAILLENALTCADNEVDVEAVYDEYAKHVLIAAGQSEKINILVFNDLSAHIVSVIHDGMYSCEDVVPFLGDEWLDRIVEHLSNLNSETRH